MKVTGFSIIKNAVINDYPIVEAIKSILPICDAFVIAVGKSDDETRKSIEDIGDGKIKIIDTVWDDSLRAGGEVFAIETDKAIKAIAPDTDWMFYIQGDECIHEKYLPVLKREMEACLADATVEGLLLKYKHFYGSYDYLAESRRWYRREIRVLKNLPNIHSYKDAQGFRIDGRKLKVKLIDAYVYHYGWVKTPTALQGKVRNFNKFYQTESWIEENYPPQQEFDLRNADRLVKFTETHPKVVQERIAALNWQFTEDLTKKVRPMNFRRRLLQGIETITGYRAFEYKNYKIVK